MDPAAARALARLRDDDARSLTELARIVVDETTATPLRAIAHPRWIASQLATALEAATHGDLVRTWVERRLDAERERVHDEERPLRAFLPSDAEAPLGKLIGRSYSPNEAFALRLIDHDAVNELLGEVLSHTVRRFQERLHLWDGGVLKNVRDEANKRSKGLLGGLRSGLGVRRNLGALGGMAENLVDAMRDEVESSVEHRISEFVKGATRDAVRSIAREAANPDRAEGFADLRLAVLDVVLDTPVSELASEGEKLHPEDIVDLVVATLSAWVAAPDFVDRMEARIAALLDETGDGTLAAWLDEVGLRDVWSDTTTELVARRLAAVVHSERFESWWGGLFDAAVDPESPEDIS
ncbi:MAG: hypothetical protein ACI8PZ_002098 [Myxococcota bacterium]|jgi:hypothetical protein